ncbi:hypothetical protein TUM4630_04170 [Shewanella algidipiscicola]|uniref:Polyketide-type polyunsaturated fatty acid synthase PfaA n=1 Tax=Shewanella algidipiscicola TaxID=614070 RepID=A0ABQ4P562_9GAMM|nr:hypothetical protein TUM4630_04170 [Shewanella algidipiscicola]
MTPPAQNTQAPNVNAPVAIPTPVVVPAIEPVITPEIVPAAPAATPGLSNQQVQDTMMSVVAEKTGYPTEMLELEMDMEADLGIDSIKRVEILGTVQDELPGLPELSPEDLAECRTLGEIVSYMNSKLPATGSAPVAANAPVANTATQSGLTNAQVQSTMMSVVAEKTGYPTEMLELEMDMEADLGIDSIKRVEILGTVQDELPGLPELSPEDLAECRTLGEIVSYMNSKLPATGSAPVAANAPVANTATQSGLTNAQVQSTMMSVVAEKTGYPTEMLELSMDMEADLGIDSIKRVEILGTVQDELPGLPELSPEDLAECRTLGEIVSYMNSKLPATGSAPVTANAPVANTATQSGLTNAQVQSTMMSVVAEKTGYPTEMLELEMDMEADLGIDSIKRVEILGTVQDELPGLPELNPEDLAECRTLGEIVSYMNSKLPVVASAPTAVNAQVNVEPATRSGLTNAQVQSTMMNVVAEKTGYPTEMLALEMDMEADLGIDSIKRVEILGTVQDELPGLPELNPEDLAECRTLGEIVNYMNSKLPAEGPMNSKLNASSSGAAPVKAEPLNDKPAAISSEPSVELPPHSEVALKKLDAAELVNNCFAANTHVVINDDGHNAGVLAEKLVKQGLNVAVVRLPKGQPQSPLNSDIKSFQADSADETGIAAVIDQIEKQLGTISGFVHLQPQQAQVANNNGVQLSDDSFNHLSQAFLWAKLLQPKLTQDTGTRRAFITVSRIDGGFGYLDAEQLKTAELNQAALAGLTKTLSHEWPSVFCRALDIAPTLDASRLSDAIANELFDSNATRSEVGLSLNDQGNVQRTALIAGDASVKTAKSDLNSADKILVTGGAKGVTFECALALAKRCQSHFILAGRSQHVSLNNLPSWAQGKAASELKSAAIAHIIASGEKPTPKQVDALVWPVQSSLEINAALDAFNAVGASAEYISMDVSNADSVNGALSAMTQITPITGLIHGAGVLADKHIQDKTLDELARVYGTKVNGLKALLSVIDASQLKLVAMFSSAAGFYGNTGQSDYAMSNDILNKAALQLSAKHPNAKVMSFNWGPWDGGMVNPALKKMFTDRGVYVIPLQAGAELFATQLLKESGVQLLVGTDMQGNSKSDTTAKEATVKKPNAGEVQPAQRPQRDVTTLTEVTLKRVLKPDALAFVQDHRIGGNPVLPTVCAIQWMREAALEQYGLTLMVQDYKLLKGIVFDSSDSQTLMMSLTPQYEAGALKGIKALISCEGRPQYQARLVKIGDMQHSTKQFDELSQVTPVTDKAALYTDGTLFHGPRLQGLDKVLRFNEQGLVVSCKLPTVDQQDCGDFAPILVAKGCQPFAEDLLLQAMLVWARLTYGAASLPSTIGEFVSALPMGFGDQGYIELTVVKTSGRQLVADVALYHQDGELSCAMRSAKVTISKNLNSAFVADQHIKEDHA